MVHIRSAVRLSRWAFTRAAFTSAAFTGAAFTGAAFTGAAFTGAAFTRAALAGAVLAAAVLVGAGCHQALPPHTVSEIPARAPVRDDPAAKGDWTQPIRLPDGAVAEDETEHDFPAYSAVHGDRFDLAPSAAREVPVAMVGASLVVARAIAFGKAGPLELAIRKDGAAAATATPIALPPDRSEAAVAANLDGSGAVTVHIANPSADPVTISLVVEIAPGGH